MKLMSAIRLLLNMAEFLSLTELLFDCQLGSCVDSLGEVSLTAGGFGEGGGEGRLTLRGERDRSSMLSGG